MIGSLATLALAWALAAATPAVALDPRLTDWSSLATWAVITLALIGASVLAEIAGMARDAWREWRRTRRPLL